MRFSLLEDAMAFCPVTRSRSFLKLSASWPTSIASGLFLAALFAPPAGANPTGGAVTTGTASISASSTHQTIDQKSEDVVIDWSSFNIASGQTTQFVQPNAQAIAVNRIGGGNASQIMGTLDANGRIVLINGNGMLFGKGSQVNVGTLVATSTDDTDSNVLAGKFTQAGNQNAAIVNQGSIRAAQGGLVALVAPTVTNAGTINVKFGTVALGAANKFTVDFAGDGLVSFATQGDVNGKATATNSGSLIGANISLTARAAEGLATGVVNMSGLALAQSARNEGGTIVLDAGDGGDISVSHATLAASGANGGGSIAIGGWNQNAVDIDAASVLNASAMNAGNGGAISVISNNTSFAGHAIAQGGAQSGNGGTIETSGHDLAFSGAAVDASAAHGAGGQWLLDPYDLTVDGSAAATIDSTLNSGTGVTLQTTATGTSGPGIQNPSGNGDIVIAAALSWHSAANLTLEAYHSIFVDAPITVTGAGSLTMLTNDGGTGGDLFFDGGNASFAKPTAALSINGASYTLVDNIATLAANIASDPSGDYALARNYNAKSDGIYTSSPISTAFSGSFEGLGNTISNLSIDDTTDADVGLFASTANGSVVRDVVLSHAVVKGYAAGASIGGLIGTMAEGSSVDNSSVSGTIVGDYAFCQSCLFSVGVGGLAGSSAGGISNSSSSASVWSEGQYDYTGGLIGADSGTIANSYATGEVHGSDDPRAGGLVGVDNATSTDNSYATGAVSGAGTNVSIGGLAGQATGLIEYSYATGNVTGGTDNAGGLVGIEGGTIEYSHATGDAYGHEVGGLVGVEQGGNSISNSISNSYATGTATGGYDATAGGLVGLNFFCNITDSYATGAVSIGNAKSPSEGFGSAGGLVGDLEPSTITSSYATGTVSGGAYTDVGGLIGENLGTVDGSYATGAVSGGKFANVGGLSGEGADISNSYATGSVSGGMDSTDGGLVGAEPYTVLYSYATGAVSGRSGSTIGGLIGFTSNDSHLFIDDYWDVTISGISNLSQGVGNIANVPQITGLTTAQFQSGLPTGFDPSIWGESAGINGGLPYLLALPPT
jgi:filamentous hemagglutinin family protein